MSQGLVACVAVGIVALVLASAPTPLQAAGTDAARRTLVHDSQARSYLLRVPAPAPGVPRALVIVLHGGGGDALNAERMTGFTEKAAREGFYVVYPEGTSRFQGRLFTWNAGHCCGHAMTTKTDDVGFIRALIDTLLHEHPVDPARVYATGLSNGGMMAHRLGRELSDRIAAIAPVVATVFGDEAPPARPVPALMINGRLDASVPHLGGPPGGRFQNAWDGTPTRPALEQGTFWAKANGCGATPRREESDAYTHWIHPCPTGRSVELYLMKHEGHTWPGGQKGGPWGDAPGNALIATDVIWAFFRQHAR